MFSFFREPFKKLLVINEFVAIPQDFNFDGFISSDIIILNAKGVDVGKIKNYLTFYQCNDFLTLTPVTQDEMIACYQSLKILEGLCFIVNNSETVRHMFGRGTTIAKTFYKDSEKEFYEVIEHWNFPKNMHSFEIDRTNHPRCILNITNVLNLLRSGVVESAIKSVVELEDSMREAEELKSQFNSLR